tara:strand:- start:2341 stop:2658 length:318 start_codon:yes stop_codon:yes gene_type:complete
VDIVETSKFFKYTFCNDHTIQLTIKSKIPQSFILYSVYNIKLSLGIEHVPKFHSQNYMEYLGVILKRTRNSIHVQSGNVHFLFPIAAYDAKPGMDVWVLVEQIKK